MNRRCDAKFSPDLPSKQTSNSLGKRKLSPFPKGSANPTHLPLLDGLINQLQLFLMMQGRQGEIRRVEVVEQPHVVVGRLDGATDEGVQQTPLRARGEVDRFRGHFCWFFPKAGSDYINISDRGSYWRFLHYSKVCCFIIFLCFSPPRLKTICPNELKHQKPQPNPYNPPKRSPTIKSNQNKHSPRHTGAFFRLSIQNPTQKQPKPQTTGLQRQQCLAFFLSYYQNISKPYQKYPKEAPAGGYCLLQKVPFSASKEQPFETPEVLRLTGCLGAFAKASTVTA